MKKKPNDYNPNLFWIVTFQAIFVERCWISKHLAKKLNQSSQQNFTVSKNKNITD